MTIHPSALRTLPEGSDAARPAVEPHQHWWSAEQRAARRELRASRGSRGRWTPGNRVQLLENGEDFFPAVYAAIDGARDEVLIETFILFEDKVGLDLHARLVAAARRGVRVTVMVDGYGSPDLSEAFVKGLRDADVRLCVFDPGRRVFGMRYKVLRRMHRKLVVVDRRIAFIGGINYSADHLADFGPKSKQDYSASVEGPIVATIHAFMRRQLDSESAKDDAPRTLRAAAAAAPVAGPAVGEAETIFVTRDNHVHRNHIELYYRIAIRSARKRVIIANAYFFPGYLLLRELRRAARRGVDVRLILQGEPDMPIVRTAALLYGYLQRDGVRIYEYCERPLHGKVAVIDDEWATVGSSNLDPLSLSLNLEANLLVRDRAFTADLAGRLEQLMCKGCHEAPRTEGRRWPMLHQLWSTLLFHVMRGFPTWAGWLPRHAPRLETLAGPGARPE